MDDMQYLLDAGDDYAVLYVMMTGIVFKVVVAYWKVKTPCHAHGECIN